MISPHFESRDPFPGDLIAMIRPSGWKNPKPRSRYHLVVVGAGTAGLVAAAGAATLGATVALVERRYMGGDCLTFGCVPSKSFIASARRSANREEATSDSNDAFVAALNEVHHVRQQLAQNDSVQRFRDLGVDVFFGDAAFAGNATVTVDGDELKFRRALIATGSRPAIPTINGLVAAGFLTNETVFSLPTLPKRLAILGAGPTGCEMAQAFANFGTKVLLVESAGAILRGIDQGARTIVETAMAMQGIEILKGSRVARVDRTNGIRLAIESEGPTTVRDVDEVLVATGRTPNAESLNLGAAGVAIDGGRIKVDHRLRTTNPSIFAAGDVASHFGSTHAADAQARIVVRNALFPGWQSTRSLVVPTCAFTSPTIAEVGLNERTAAEKGIPVEPLSVSFDHVDSAVLDGSPKGFVKVLVRPGTDRILGATIVGEQAGELISFVELAMSRHMGLVRLGQTIFPYPTRGDVFRRLSDQIRRRTLSPFVQKALRAVFFWH